MGFFLKDGLSVQNCLFCVKFSAHVLVKNVFARRGVACKMAWVFFLTSCEILQSPAKVKVRMWDEIMFPRLFPGRNSTLSHQLEKQLLRKRNQRLRYDRACLTCLRNVRLIS